ncbi:cytochrome P450 [Hypoxylon crocopeplum]|nr:cytochrome P450 [Hypoxylon crocopeplum]
MALRETVYILLPNREDVAAILTIRSILVLICIWAVYKLFQASWNLSPFHPLSHIPGPKLAGATYLPEFWHDAVKFGRYTHEIKRMHDIYGPVVRINPHEIHCNDAQFVDEIYAMGNRKREKSHHHMKGVIFGDSTFGTISHDVHRARRAPLGKFFSKIQITQFESEIQLLVQSLCDKLLAEEGQASPLKIQSAYSCFTSDVISIQSFGESFGFLAQKSWEPNLHRPSYVLLKGIYVFRFFPFLRHTMAAGAWFSNYLPKDTALLIKTLNIDLPNYIKKVKADMDAGIVRERPTVFGELLTSGLPEQGKSLGRLSDEAASVLTAGTETTSFTLAVLTYHVLSRPEILAKLTAEVASAVHDPNHLPPWAALERLPYLSAVIQEGLRLSYGTTARSARIAPDEDLVYRGSWNPPGRSEKGAAAAAVEYVIPRGFAVGMSTPLLHHDEAIFPDSYAFVPERWLDDNMKRKKELDRYLMSFSRGPRVCVGMHLATCELYLAVAALTLRVFPHMRLFETTEDDVKWDHDMIVPLIRDDRKGVRVVVV